MKLMIGSRRSSQRAKPLLGVYGNVRSWNLLECVGAKKGAGTSDGEEAYPILILVSVRKAYCGTSRLLGAGPLRMRPETS